MGKISSKILKTPNICKACGQTVSPPAFLLELHVLRGKNGNVSMKSTEQIIKEIGTDATQNTRLYTLVDRGFAVKPFGNKTPVYKITTPGQEFLAIWEKKGLSFKQLLDNRKQRRVKALRKKT